MCIYCIYVSILYIYVCVYTRKYIIILCINTLVRMCHAKNIACWVNTFTYVRIHSLSMYACMVVMIGDLHVDIRKGDSMNIYIYIYIYYYTLYSEIYIT